MRKPPKPRSILGTAPSPAEKSILAVNLLRILKQIDANFVGMKRHERDEVISRFMAWIAWLNLILIGGRK